MKSNIKIKLKFSCIIGLLEHERLAAQPVKLLIKASANEFLDYAAVAKMSKKYLKKKRFKTIEKALEKLSAKLKRKFNQITFLHLYLSKTAIIEGAEVGCYIDKFYED